MSSDFKPTSAVVMIVITSLGMLIAINAFTYLKNVANSVQL
jgi:hypothetical protein